MLGHYGGVVKARVPGTSKFHYRAAQCDMCPWQSGIELYQTKSRGPIPPLIKLFFVFFYDTSFTCHCTSIIACSRHWLQCALLFGLAEGDEWSRNRTLALRALKDHLQTPRTPCGDRSHSCNDLSVTLDLSLDRHRATSLLQHIN